jgi:hypothetical protein
VLSRTAGRESTPLLWELSTLYADEMLSLSAQTCAYRIPQRSISRMRLAPVRPQARQLLVTETGAGALFVASGQPGLEVALSYNSPGS